jgi:hypothetical protein
VRICLNENPSLFDTRIDLGTAHEAVVAEVRHVPQVLGQGRAAPPSNRKS